MTYQVLRLSKNNPQTRWRIGESEWKKALKREWEEEEKKNRVEKD